MLFWHLAVKVKTEFFRNLKWFLGINKLFVNILDAFSSLVQDVKIGFHQQLLLVLINQPHLFNLMLQVDIFVVIISQVINPVEQRSMLFLQVFYKLFPFGWGVEKPYILFPVFLNFKAILHYVNCWLHSHHLFSDAFHGLSQRN